MDHLLQFYSPNYPNFAISNTMSIPIPIMQAAPAIDENDNDFKEIISDGKKYVSCAFPGCGKIYRYKSEFIRHKVIHTSQRTINCPFKGCTKTFKREDVLKSHIRIHTGETPYKCQEANCGQSFSSQAGLKYHSLKHKGEKEYRCSFPGCNKTFLIQSQLRQHESALNYHQKISNQASSHEEDHSDYSPSNVKVVKYEDTTCSSSISQEIKHEVKAEWGVKIQHDDDTQHQKIDKNLEEDFERMIKALIDENNAMKMKLNMFYSSRGLMRENSRQSQVQELSNERNFSFIKLEAK